MVGMTRMRGFVLAASAALTWTVAQAAESPPLSLPEAIEQALAQNPAQVSRRLETERAAKGQDAARGARGPSLNFNTSATYYGYPALVVPIREVGVFPPLDDTIYDLGVALKLPIYTGGRLTQEVALADLSNQVAIEQLRQGRQELVFNVSSVYLKIVQLSKLEAAYAARIASLESQEKRVKLLVQVGRAPRLDLLRIGVQLAKARHDRLQVQNSREQAYTLFYSLLGREAPEVPAPLVSYAAADAAVGALEEFVRAAGELRPELRIARGRLASSEAQADIVRSQRLPDVSLIGVYRERTGGTNVDFLDDWNVGVQLSVPLYDGGVRRAQVEQAVLAREQAQQTVEQTRLDIHKQVRDAWYAHAEAQSRAEVTARSVQEAEEALSIERLRYEQGVGLVTDLLDAESALLTAQADRLQGEFDLIITRVDLLRASGQLEPQHVIALVSVPVERRPEDRP